MLMCITIGHENVPASSVGDILYHKSVPYCAECVDLLRQSLSNVKRLVNPDYHTIITQAWKTFQIEAETHPQKEAFRTAMIKAIKSL